MALANECADAASACVKAARRLFALAAQAAEGSTDPSRSIAYSLGIDGGKADLHIHWFDGEDGSFKAERMHKCFLFVLFSN